MLFDASGVLHVCCYTLYIHERCVSISLLHVARRVSRSGDIINGEWMGGLQRAGRAVISAVGKCRRPLPPSPHPRYRIGITRAEGH